MLRFDDESTEELVSTTKSSDATLNRSVEFKEKPVDCYCQYCKRSAVSYVEFEASWVTYLLAILVFFVFGILSFCIIPFIWVILRDAVHRCPLCLNELNRHNRLSLPTVSNGVVTFQCGNCAIVLSYKYVIALICMLLLIFTFSIARWYFEVNGAFLEPRGPLIENTWDDYLEACGRKVQLGNALHSIKSFDSTYRGNTVKWRGRVLQVSEPFFSKSMILIKMDPQQYKHDYAPDIALFFRKDLYSKVEDLEVDDAIEFVASLLIMGNRGRPTTGILWDIRNLKSEGVDGFKKDVSDAPT